MSLEINKILFNSKIKKKLIRLGLAYKKMYYNGMSI